MYDYAVGVVSGGSEVWPGIAYVCAPADRTPPDAGSGRARSLKKTFRQVWGLRQQLKITRIADITELDRLGIPVFTSTRPSVHEVQITTTQGKGLRAVEAITAALLEAVERHSAATFKADLRLATAEQLAGAGIAHVSPAQLGAACGDAEPIEWVSSVSLKTGRPVLMPAAEVMFPYFPPEGVLRPVRPSTTGLSAGNTPAEAILHSLFEVIERDAVSRLMRGWRAKLLDLGSVTGETEMGLIARFRKAGVDLCVLDLSDFSLAPTFRAVSFDSSVTGAQLIAIGQGTSISPAVALRRALLEAAQARVVAIQGSREDLRKDLRKKSWKLNYERDKMRFEIMRFHANGAGVTRLPAADDSHRLTVEAVLQTICQRVLAAGYQDVVYTDVTDPSIGIPTTHVSVPGMVDLVVEPERKLSANRT